MKDFSDFMKYCNDQQILDSIYDIHLESVESHEKEHELITKHCIKAVVRILQAYHEWQNL